MATAASMQDLLEEATCSICLDYFQDPVLIPECGHNFCRGCLTRSWGTSESEASCPQCRQTFAPRNILPNRQLARVLEVARRCGSPWGEDGGSFCTKHREPLKLFCKHHETLICVVCDRSEEHRGHSVIPAEEAFQKYQDHIEKEKKNVVAEFRELQLLLEGQEELLLARMEETEKEIMAIKEKGHWKHLEEVSESTLLFTVSKIGSSSSSFPILESSVCISQYQANETYENPVDLLPELKWTIWDYSDIIALLKSGKKKLKDTLESGLQLQEVNVSLNPRTADPDVLVISKDQKSVKRVEPKRLIYADPNRKRFVPNPYVLGCQRFSTGRHFWEVTVGDTAGWGVGVAKKPVKETYVDMQISQWVFRKWGEKYMVSSPSYSEFVLTEKPTRIRISLNCEMGQVSFFDARTAALLHTFSDSSLVGETLLPSFSLDEGASLTLP
ncbi:hypothetical protein Chor_011608 [Crotalus horridus]